MRLHHKQSPSSKRSASTGRLPSVDIGRRAVSLATTMVLGSGLLTACGDSRTAGADGEATLTVGVAGNIFDVPLRVADAQGYFSKRGLKVKFVTVTAATGTPRLASGSLQFLNSSPTSFLSGIAKKLPVVAIGVDGLGNPLGLVVSRTFARLHGLTSKSPASDVARALKGSTGGFSSANTKAEAAIFLNNTKIDPKDVTWVALSSPSADKAALDSGRIDWFVTSEPLPLQIQRSGDGVVVADSQKVPQWASDYAGYGQVLVARKSYAGQHAATVKDFVAAVQEGTAYLTTHVNDPSVVAVAEKALPGVPGPVVQASIQEVEYPFFADMNVYDWRKTFTFVSELGGLPEEADITGDDWTNQYVR